MAKENKKGKTGGGTTSRLFIQLILALLAIFLFIGSGLFVLGQQGAKQRASVQVEAVAQGIARKLSTIFTIYTDAAARMVRNPGLVAALENEDWQEINSQQALLKQLLPEVDSVRLFPYEWDKLNEKASPPISFASLEMLRGVERTGKPSVAEVHQAGGAQAHIAMAVPVLNGNSGSIVGVVQLVLPMQLLNRLFSDGWRYSGAISLQQVVNSGRITLASSSPSGLEWSSADGEVPVEGTLWRLIYRGDHSSAGEVDQLLVWGLLGLGLVISVVAVLVLLQRVDRALKRDSSTLLSLLDSLLSGDGDRVPPSAAVVELQEVINRLARSGLKMKAAANMIPAKQQAERAAVASAVEKAALAEEPRISGRQVEAKSISESIFRAYDIRGVVNVTLFPDAVYLLGRAIGTMAGEVGEQTVIIGRDGRNSSQSFAEALARGLNESGRDVVDIGLVPTPVLYFATHFLGSSSGVMVTGSHNAPEYNGLKMVLAGESLSPEQIKQIHQRIISGDLSSGKGKISKQDLVPDYISRVAEDVQLLGSLKLVIDCGSGAASVVAPALFRSLGCDVIDLFCEVNGNFPYHHPNPGDPENMQSLIQKVESEGADLGVAFDGDGDRIGVVDSEGKIIWPDRLLMLLASDVLLRNPGADVIYDVKSSRNLASEILTYGGRPIMWKSGHSLVKAKMRETGALLAAEMSGHIYFKERWYGFDDGLYACARLLEVLSAEGLPTADIFSQYPESVATPEFYAPTKEGENFVLMEDLSDKGLFPGAKLVTIDGIRAEFEDGWGLVRPSNTSPALVFRFEADSSEALSRIQGVFREQLEIFAPDLKVPF